MDTLQGIDELGPWRGCTFVPTMGALHEGHCALISQAADRGGKVLVSIFVNPSQFAPHEDLDRYPRELDKDLTAAAAAGADAVFVPDLELVYPPEQQIATPDLPEVATRPGLEDAQRPHFFGGVCRVVARLFDLVQPSSAIFGEKDWQQLQVIRALVRREPKRFPLQIVSGPTVRERDGLALSSRNAYLHEDERPRALALHLALQAAATTSNVAQGEAAMRAQLDKANLRVDYAVIRDARTLVPCVDANAPRRALIAAWVDSIRLIDNCGV
jgi:pantoate--beta-alanine ligase